MVKICFVCLGNICRSPMAEFIMKDLIIKENLINSCYITSRATSYEEIGNGIYYKTKNKLEEKNINFDNLKKAKRLEKEDYDKYDYIIGMETSNINSIKKIMEGDFDKKVYRLLDFTNNPRDIADPWYTDNFDKTYEDILEGCISLLNYIKKEGIL